MVSTCSIIPQSNNDYILIYDSNSLGIIIFYYSVITLEYLLFNTVVIKNKEKDKEESTIFSLFSSSSCIHSLIVLGDKGGEWWRIQGGGGNFVDITVRGHNKNPCEGCSKHFKCHQ